MRQATGRLRGRPARRAGTAAALVLLLGGCGSDGEHAAGPSASPAASPSADPSTTAPAERPTDPSTRRPSGEPTGLTAPADDTWEPWSKGRPRTDLASRTDPDGTAAFTAADGALACVVGPDGPQDATVRCDRADGLGADQPRPPGCDGEWGDAVSADTVAGGRLLCAADSAFDLVGRPGQGTVLQDGDVVRYRGLTCTSRADAVQCLGPSSRGFVVSARALVVR